MNGRTLLHTVNYFSLVLAVLAFMNSFSFLPAVKWIGVGVILGIFGALFFAKKLWDQDYETFLVSVKRGFFMLVLLLILSVYKEDYKGALNELSPFILLYVISAVTALRALRQRQYAGENKLIGRMNYVYAVTLMAGAFALGEEHSRRFIGKVLGRVWKAVPDFLIKAAENLIFYILTVLAKPFVWLASLLRGKKLVIDEGINKKGNGKPWFNFEDPYVDKLSAFLNHNVVRAIIWGILLSLMVYFALKVFQKRKRRNITEDHYEEEREFFIKHPEQKDSLLKQAFRMLRPRENNEKIRYYYGKLLSRCIKERVEIEMGDTAADVNKKSPFDPEKMEQIRETYIKVRYSDYSATGEDVKTFAKKVHEL